MGMLIYQELRGRGMAKLLVATWLQLCVRRGVEPRTHRMDKPLISLVLQRFGFTASDRLFGITISHDPPDQNNPDPRESHDMVSLSDGRYPGFPTPPPPPRARESHDMVGTPPNYNAGWVEGAGCFFGVFFSVWKVPRIEISGKF